MGVAFCPLEMIITNWIRQTECSWKLTLAVIVWDYPLGKIYNVQNIYGLPTIPVTLGQPSRVWKQSYLHRATAALGGIVIDPGILLKGILFFKSKRGR